MNRLVNIIICLIFPLVLWAQEIPLLERSVSIEVVNSPVTEVLQSISRQTGIRFSYNPDILKNIPPVSISFQKKPTRLVLNKIFGDKIKFKARGKYIILQKEKTADKVKIIEGYINEPLTGKNIGNATVYDKTTYASAITNQYGYFRMEVPESDTNNVIMVSKAGKTDTLLTSIPAKSEIVELNFNPEKKDSIRATPLVFSDTAKKNSFFPDWLVSETLLVNTFNLTDTFFKSVSLSILPFISTNRLLTGNSVNNISVNLTVGYCQEIRVAEFGMVNIVRDNVRYVQLGYFGNIVGGHMLGYQASSFFNISNSLRGMQHSGFLNICHYVDGGQLASFFNKSNDIKGVQIAGVINKTNGIKGGQIAGIGNVADTVTGVQVAGIFNRSEIVNGAQIAGITNIADRNNKAQVAGIVNTADSSSVQVAGIVNVTGITNSQTAGLINIAQNVNKTQIAGLINTTNEFNGIQLAGLINVTSKANGIQIGVFNFADSCKGISIGVLNFVKHGVHSIELSGDETGFASFSVRIGVKKFYNILAFGAKPDQSSEKQWYYSYGIGTSYDLLPKLAVFGEISKQEYLQKKYFENQVDLFKIAIGTSYQWKKNLAFTAALSLNLMNHDPLDARQLNLSKSIAPYKVFVGHLSNDSELNSWMGIRFGIRFF